MNYQTLLSIIICASITLNISCTKNSSQVLERVDTVKYESILNATNGYWCVQSFKPVPLYPGSSQTSYIVGECGLTQNQEVEFTVNKYKNKPITLWTKGYDQFYDSGANAVYYDSIVTLNIYINNLIVATQSSRSKDSIQYIIY